ncbi:ParB/RepB/Spo0J family partition protein [Gemmatimonas aurantiaca]|nr:ParB/RepB/Spo0J family partition protein [Gemmatimonas aurantiaca]
MSLEQDNREVIEEIELNAIFPNRLQPRQSFSDAKLTELAESLKRDGILQPLLVTKERSGYMLIAGERRLRAARLAGMTTAPVRVMPQMDDAKLLRLALIENIQREDLNPIETAQAYKALIERYSMSQTDLSEQLGKSRSAIANSLRLLNLSERIRGYVSAGKLTEGHARALLTISDPEIQETLAQRAMIETLSVRHLEDVTRKTKKRRLIPKHRDVDIMAAETTLKRALQAPVKIKPGLKNGKIEIKYKGVEDLNRLLDLLQTVRM